MASAVQIGWMASSAIASSAGSTIVGALLVAVTRERNNGDSLAIGLKSLIIDFDDAVRNAPFDADINFQGFRTNVRFLDLGFLT